MASTSKSTAPLFRPREQLQPHESLARVPQMPPKEYAAFRADIEARGIQVPLEITADGTLLDGRHRLRAASELGIEQLPVRIVAPDDPAEHVLLAALQRRHLSASQRAALALELDDYRQAKATAEQTRLANLNQVTNDAPLLPRGERSRELAARAAGVSPRTVQDAAHLSVRVSQLSEHAQRVVPRKGDAVTVGNGRV